MNFVVIILIIVWLKQFIYWICICFHLVVAKRTSSPFDDPTMEIQELTAVIKQDITALNSAVVDLQLLCNSRNDSGNISSDTTSHSTTVVDDLKHRLMSTTKEFKEVLTMQTEVTPNTGFILLTIQFGQQSEWESVALLFLYRFLRFLPPSPNGTLLLFFWRVWRLMRTEDNCILLLHPRILLVLLFVSVHWLPGQQLLVLRLPLLLHGQMGHHLLQSCSPSKSLFGFGLCKVTI